MLLLNVTDTGILIIAISLILVGGGGLIVLFKTFVPQELIKDEEPVENEIIIIPEPDDEVTDEVTEEKVPSVLSQYPSHPPFAPVAAVKPIIQKTF